MVTKTLGFCDWKLCRYKIRFYGFVIDFSKIMEFCFLNTSSISLFTHGFMINSSFEHFVQGPIMK